MKYLIARQDSQEWEDQRSALFGASECASMLGIEGAYLTRSQLLKQKKTGIKEEVNSYLQHIFNLGHQAEANARPIIEAQYNLILSPVSGQLENSKISASFDGHDCFENIIWEHKLFRDSNKSQLRFNLAKENKVAEFDMAQIQQQLLVSGAKYCLFTVSDGTTENMATAIIYPNLDWFEQIKNGWAQFEQDLNQKLYLTDDNPELISKLNQLKLNREEIKKLEILNKEIEESAFNLLKEQGADEIKCGNAIIKSSFRKGTINYSIIPELKDIDLEQYRNESKLSYSIVFGE